MRYYMEKSLELKEGSEEDEIFRFEFIPSSNTAAAARSELGGSELD
jgi:hypothetical protein